MNTGATHTHNTSYTLQNPLGGRRDEHKRGQLQGRPWSESIWHPTKDEKVCGPAGRPHAPSPCHCNVNATATKLAAGAAQPPHPRARQPGGRGGGASEKDGSRQDAVLAHTVSRTCRGTRLAAAMKASQVAKSCSGLYSAQINLGAHAGANGTRPHHMGHTATGNRGRSSAAPNSVTHTEAQCNATPCPPPPPSSHGPST